jgi:16S rRNA (adenine1518-N6/adenine1519-N6)-dimethyltransferase
VIAGPGELLRRHGLSARKQWGQHFLHDPYVHAAIVEAARVGAGDRVVEIGAGLGTLTGALLQTGADVWAIERDRDLCTVLRAELHDHRGFTLCEADAVRFDYARAVDETHPKPVVVGNLPYHLTGPLLFTLLAHHEHTGRWIVMVQREVADRMCAEPGSKRYGGLTVALSRLRRIDTVIRVSPGAFVPPPKVDSTVVRLDPLPQPRGAVADFDGFLHLVRTAFQQRRKTLVNALSPLAGKAAALRWCEAAAVAPGVRPEQVAVEGFAALQRARESEHA